MLFRCFPRAVSIWLQDWGQEQDARRYRGIQSLLCWYTHWTRATTVLPSQGLTHEAGISAPLVPWVPPLFHLFASTTPFYLYPTDPANVTATYTLRKPLWYPIPDIYPKVILAHKNSKVKSCDSKAPKMNHGTNHSVIPFLCWGYVAWPIALGWICVALDPGTLGG